MGRVNFSEDNGLGIGQENLRILWNPKFSTVFTRANRWSVHCATWRQFRPFFLKMHVNVPCHHATIYIYSPEMGCSV